MSKIIIVKNPNNLPTIDYHKLKILQGDLKTLSKENLTKLCKSIKRYGYFVPAFIWRSGNDFWILDATQRYHALEQLNRICYGIEIEPKYIDVILDRYAKFTEDDPIREDGVKWSELKSSKIV